MQNQFLQDIILSYILKNTNLLSVRKPRLSRSHKVN